MDTEVDDVCDGAGDRGKTGEGGTKTGNVIVVVLDTADCAASEDVDGEDLEDMVEEDGRAGDCCGDWEGIFATVGMPVGSP